MAILLTPDQIPQLWKAIKFAAVNADHVEEEYRERYLNQLLYQLLASKAQCFVRLSPERKLQAIAVTKITVDEVRDEKSLFIMTAYSFEKVDPRFWIDDIETLRKFAKKNECKTVTAWATTDKSETLAELIGLKPRFKSYIMEV